MEGHTLKSLNRLPYCMGCCLYKDLVPGSQQSSIPFAFLLSIHIKCVSSPSCAFSFYSHLFISQWLTPTLPLLFSSHCAMTVRALPCFNSSKAFLLMSMPPVILLLIPKLQRGNPIEKKKDKEVIIAHGMVLSVTGRLVM